MPEISLRQARTFLAVARDGNVTRGAKAVNRSQTSVTKSIHELEQHLGVSVFDRGPRGVNLTTFGEALYRWTKAAAATFLQIGKLFSPSAVRTSTGITRLANMDVSDRWLDAFLATVQSQSIAAAATELSITPSAVATSLRKLEVSLGTNLFERTSAAIVPTTLGNALAGHIKLARHQFRHALDEIAAMQGVERGSVVVGTLPFARTIIVPTAINQLLTNHPNIDVATIEGSYDDQVAALRCGDIDFMVGALRETAVTQELQQEILLEDSLAIVVRSGHPLIKSARTSKKELSAYEWVLPRQGTPTRTLFEQAIVEHGVPVPKHVVETSSLVMLRGLLLGSDRLSVLSRHQIYYEESSGLLAALPYPLKGTTRPIGITRRARTSLSPAADLMIEEIRKVVADQF